jgi:hypothetical protein
MNNHRRAVIGCWVCVATIVGGGYLGVAGWPDVAGLAAHSVQAVRGDATVRPNSPGRPSATNTTSMFPNSIGR